MSKLRIFPQTPPFPHRNFPCFFRRVRRPGCVPIVFFRIFVRRKNAKTDFYAKTTVRIRCRVRLSGRRRPAGNLFQSGDSGRPARSQRHPRRRDLLCLRNLFGVGAFLSALHFARPGELDAGGPPVRRAARMDPLVVLGPGAVPPRRADLRLLYGPPQERRHVVYRRGHGRPSRRPLHGPRSGRRAGHRGHRRLRAGGRRETLHLVEGLRSRPAADRTAGLPPFGRRPAARGRAVQPAARRCAAGAGGPALDETRRLLLPDLCRERLLRPRKRLCRFGGAVEKPPRTVREIRRESDPARRRRGAVLRPRHGGHHARRPHVLPLPCLSFGRELLPRASADPLPHRAGRGRMAAFRGRRNGCRCPARHRSR